MHAYAFVAICAEAEHAVAAAGELRSVAEKQRGLAQDTRSRGADARAAAKAIRERVQAWRDTFIVGAILPIGYQGHLICVLDGDGTTLCSGSRATKIVGYDWRDVRLELRCPCCDLVLGGMN